VYEYCVVLCVVLCFVVLCCVVLCCVPIQVVPILKDIPKCMCVNGAMVSTLSSGPQAQGSIPTPHPQFSPHPTTHRFAEKIDEYLQVNCEILLERD
jgi:hypothetical protein